MYHAHRKCRACSGTDLVPVLDLMTQPLANDFRKPGEECAGMGPLVVLMCRRCSLAQLSVTVRPDVMYANYSYVTSKSETMAAHFDRIMQDIIEDENHRPPACPPRMLEIGSNDGTFLERVHRFTGYEVLGVEPASNLSTIAIDRGVRTINRLWDTATAVELSYQKYQADVIVARHVFCHVDDWQGFVHALEFVSHKDTLVFIEVPYVKDMFKNNSFDQCLPPGQKIVTDSGFEEIQNVKLGQRVLTHTGAYKEVTNIFENPFEGDIVEITAYGQNTPLAVTPEHPLYVWRDGEARFIEAKSIKIGDRLMKPVVRETFSSDARSLSVIHPNGRNSQPAKTVFPIGENLCKVMGFYLAEGFYFECKKGAAQVTFAFGKSESEAALADECLCAIRSLGSTARKHLTKCGWHVETSGHMARLLHRELGTGAPTKHVPSWMYQESKENIERFVWAYIRGDGYVYRGGKYWRASTVSEDLAQGVAVLANKLGFCASVNFGKPLGLRRIHKNPNWSLLTKPPIDILIRLDQTKKLKVYSDDQYQYGLVRSIRAKHYAGTVHNIEVDGDSSYVTVQGAVHNCYHEHLSYMSVMAMVHLLAGTKFKLHKIIPYEIHGGAIGIMLRHVEHEGMADVSVDQYTVS
jgi:hypothetical protein